MVKGISRRVIVVSSPDKRYFDEAIFILRGDLSAAEEGSAAVEQAQAIAARVAARYGRDRARTAEPPTALLWTLLGAALMALLWVVTTLP